MRSSSGTSQRKKIEEQNAQAIKQLLTQQENKFCFECGQRGPTYVNMTNGTYCCMHCSGLLRGLRPPHRVKAITMSTFTNEDVERLRTLGNAVNAGIYLGLYDGKKKFEPRVDDEVKSHLVEKYENRRWYVSPDDLERQKQLLEEHAAHRRNSWSAVSQKSNQSAPPNLHPPQASARSGPVDLLTGDLFDLSLSSTPVQQSVPATAQQPQTELKQDDWFDLFTKPVAPSTESSFPQSASTVPAALKFPMPAIPPPKPKEHTVLTSSSSTSASTQPAFHQQWESFGAIPKSSTIIGVVSAPPASNQFDELFSNFTANPQQNGELKSEAPKSNQANIDFGLDLFGTAKPAQSNNSSTKMQKVPDQWNPFLS